MSNKHQQFMKQLVEAVLDEEGVTDRALRTAVKTAAAAGKELGAEDGSIPAVLRPYLQKVSRHAYKVTDRDVEALKTAGYSEDSIFELTISAAVGAGLGRLERGLAALNGTRSAQTGVDNEVS